MKAKGFVATILVILFIAMFPLQTFAGEYMSYKTSQKSVRDVAQLGYNVEVLQDFLDLEDFREYLVTQVLQQNIKIDISEYHLPVQDNVIEAIAVILFKDTPETFNVGNVSFSILHGELLSLNVTYLYDEQQFNEMLSQCESIAESIVADIVASPDMPQAFKALLVHDRLAALCTYDRNLENDNRFDLYGALVEGYAVCEGYTKAYAYLLEKIGIKAEFCSSEELSHAWNIVYIDGEAYHVDVTWDDASTLAGEVYHDNFLKSTTAIKENSSEFFFNSHEADDFNSTPNSTTYDNYFWQNSYTEFQYINGDFYYIDNKIDSVYKYVEDGEDQLLYTGSAKWNKYWNRYSRLSSDGEDLFFSTNTSVYHYDLETGNISEAFAPEEVKSASLEIYGFMYEDEYLICDLADTNNYFYSEIVRVKKLYDPGSMDLVPVPNTSVVQGSSQTYYYPLGSELDVSNIELSITYQDGTVRSVKEGLVVSGANFDTPGKKTITITWEDVQAHFEVEVYIKGDVNGDGRVTVSDATLIQKSIASLVELDGRQVASAETTGDKVVSVTDATRIQKYLAGVTDSLG